MLTPFHKRFLMRIRSCLEVKHCDAFIFQNQQKITQQHVDDAGTCRIADRGQALKAGEVILSGALGPMVALSAGDLGQADMGALGSVACRMV